MANIDIKIDRTNGPASAQSRAVAASHPMNPKPEFDANMFRQPDYHVYIFSISKRDFNVSQPPLVSRMYIPACGEGDRYIRVAAIPHPFNQYDRESGNGETVIRAHTAEFVAASIINPNNPTLDQDAVIPDAATLGLGVDLTCQGIFWSRNATPTDEELKRAHARRERYYRTLLENARVLEISDPSALVYTINRDYHMAAEYFGEERSWHRKYVQRAECPNCGDSIKAGLAYHTSTVTGKLCIIDKARAKAAGVEVAA